jgi:REP element-mobilizing transposase RayT
MARKARLEVEGGLYHVITRGNDRQDIFHDHEGRRGDRLAIFLVGKKKPRYWTAAFLFVT